MSLTGPTEALDSPLNLIVSYNGFVTKIPKSLQGALWSVNVSKLDLEEDKPYIVNQILAYGTLDEIRWLIKTYGKEEVKKVFIDKPIKVYTPPALKFSQLLLDIPVIRTDRYDQTLPRSIR